MTGETIFGISLINREVAPTPGGGKVSLRMILFSYINMQADKFSLFAELHQLEEMGPKLAIIPACKEAERIVNMMNKQVAAFLFYYLTMIAALPKKFVKELLKAMCDVRLVVSIDDRKWDSDTLTITTPHKEKEEEDMEELKKASWWNNAFDLEESGKKAQSARQTRSQRHSLTLMMMTYVCNRPLPPPPTHVQPRQGQGGRQN
jgi:hypothetical protein